MRTIHPETPYERGIRTNSAEMPTHERMHWQTLLELGATETEIAMKRALDVRTVQTRSQKQLMQLIAAVRGVDSEGRSRVNHWHVSRQGQPTFIVTDECA